MQLVSVAQKRVMKKYRDNTLATVTTVIISPLDSQLCELPFHTQKILDLLSGNTRKSILCTSRIAFSKVGSD